MKTLIPVVALLLVIGLTPQAAPDTTKEDLDFKIGDDWKIASRSETNGLLTVEYSHNGDDVNNWKEHFTYLRGVRRHALHSPEDEVKIMKAHMEERCPGASDWNVIAKNENSILYEWQSKPCGGATDMHQIARIVQGKYNYFDLLYTARVLQLEPDIRAQWIKTFSDATITTDSSTDSPVSNAESKDVDEVVPFAADKVSAALRAAMESAHCNVTEATAGRIECKRERSFPGGRSSGGESITATLEAQGDQTRVRISTGKGFYGRLGKQNWSTAIYQEMMKGLQEAHPGPITVSPQASVSPQAPSGTVQDMASKLSSANWGENPTADAYLELKETDRKKVQGHTEVTYHIKSSGFPAGKAYTLWYMQSGDQKVAPSMGGFSVDSTGELVCPAAPQPGNSTPVSHPCMPSKTLKQSVALTFSTYHKGEPIDLAVLSSDGTARAFARAYPFPITVQDGKCTLNVEMENSEFTSFVIRGTGFEPGENVRTSSSFGKDITSGTQQASAKGELAAAMHADLPGKNSGSATFAATGNSCHPTVTYEWGKAAMKAQ